MGTFALGRFSGRNDAYGLSIITLEVTDNQNARLVAKSEHQKSVFRF